MSFRALRVIETSAGKFERSIVEREIDDLPQGEVLIKIKYSSLNYKDALSATGNKGITKNFPHTPGIDAAGVVEISRNPNFATGEEVIVTGYDLGMNTDGGMAEYIRVPGQWIVPKPPGVFIERMHDHRNCRFHSCPCVTQDATLRATSIRWPYRGYRCHRRCWEHVGFYPGQSGL